MQPIYYDGHPVAMADEHRFWLTHSIELLPDGHPTKRMVLLMCSFARDVLAGELPAPYSDARAERFAREALLPGRRASCAIGERGHGLGAEPQGSASRGHRAPRRATAGLRSAPRELRAGYRGKAEWTSLFGVALRAGIR
jgi:hypothetical protein